MADDSTSPVDRSARASSTSGPTLPAKASRTDDRRSATGAPIRLITRADASDVVGLAVSSGLFAPEDVGVVERLIADYFADTRDTDDMCFIASTDVPLAVAYIEPAVATDRTWQLTMIAVRADHHGHGHGSTLLAHVEDVLRRKRQRLLLVETSGTPAFQRTRDFYAKCGYEQEARVRDYYEAGDDMILFRKDVGGDEASTH